MAAVVVIILQNEPHQTQSLIVCHSTPQMVAGCLNDCLCCFCVWLARERFGSADVLLWCQWLLTASGHFLHSYFLICLPS